MTTPAGFIPSPLDHATPMQGQQLQAARGAAPNAANQTLQGGALGYAQAAAPWVPPGFGMPPGQVNSPAAPAEAPAPANGTDGIGHAAARPPQPPANRRENGIAPTTPGRGTQLPPPFKLVAPNADMRDIPATFVGPSQAHKGGAGRTKPTGATPSKSRDAGDRPRSVQQEPSASTVNGATSSGGGTAHPAMQFRPNEGHLVNGHGSTAGPMAPQPLLLPNGHMLTQIAPLTPEQLAELAQNTQLKNQLYAQLLYRSMAQTSPGQSPMQLQHLLSLSQPLLATQPPQAPSGAAGPPLAGVPGGDLVQNPLVMPMGPPAPAPAPAHAALEIASASPAHPSASQQPGTSQAVQNQLGAANRAASASPQPQEPGSASRQPAGGCRDPRLGQAAQPETADEEIPDAGPLESGAAHAPSPISGPAAEQGALPSNAAAAPSLHGEGLGLALKGSDVNLASSSSGNAAGAADGKAEEVSDANPLARSAQDASKPPLIIRNWGSVGGGFVPFGAGQQKIAPKGGKVLPQGSVKAKPSAAIGAALGPNLVLPNGNVSGPRACAPVEAFELPGSVAKSIPAVSTVSGGPSNSDPVLPSTTPPPPTSLPAPTQAAPKLEPPAHSSAVPGAKVPHPSVPMAKPKPGKSRAQLEGEERKRGPAGRTSMYKGVTKHRRSGRWEAHVWVREDGKQAYLGGYSTEEEAAEAHDVAALKCHGLKAKTNFHISRYTALLDRLDTVPMAELVMAIRRTSPGFTRGSSSFRGVTQHKSGRWEVRIGLRGSKHVYLGLHTSEVEAARVYDRALVLLTGQTAATNFPVSNYKNQMEAYEQRLTKGEELPGFQEDGEYSERAFEAWLREQAILPAQEEPTSSKPVPHPKSPEAAAAPTDNGEAPKPEATKPPVPRRTAPERKRKPPAALLDADSEGSSPPALALNGSPRPGAKRKRSVLVVKRPRSSQHNTDGILNLSQVGKPKQGRPRPRRKMTEPSDNDTAAILMNLAAVAGEASGRPGSSRSRGARRLAREEEDVEISDDEEDEEEAIAWSPGRKQRGEDLMALEDGEATKEEDPDLAHHVFVPPSALILGEPPAPGECSTTISYETRSALHILKHLGATAAEIPPVSEPEAAQHGQWDLFTAWLGVCSVIGHMAHTMAILALQYEGTAE